VHRDGKPTVLTLGDYIKDTPKESASEKSVRLARDALTLDEARVKT